MMDANGVRILVGDRVVYRTRLPAEAHLTEVHGIVLQEKQDEPKRLDVRVMWRFGKPFGPETWQLEPMDMARLEVLR